MISRIQNPLKVEFVTVYVRVCDGTKPEGKERKRTADEKNLTLLGYHKKQKPDGAFPPYSSLLDSESTR